jgi:CDGSH-type Zn-finger protein
MERGSDAEGARITPYRNGPYLIRGPFTLTDQDGNEIEVARKIVALCRCGKSRTRPFCDGTHKAVGFEAESGREGRRVSRSAGAAAGPQRDR